MPTFRSLATMAIVAVLVACAGVGTAAALSSAAHHSQRSAAARNTSGGFSRSDGGKRHHPKKHPTHSHSAAFVTVIDHDMITPIKDASAGGVMLTDAKRSEHQIDACAAELLNGKAGKRDGGTWAPEAIEAATRSAAGAQMTASFSRGYLRLAQMTSKTRALSTDLRAAARYYATLQSYSGFCGAVHQWKKDGFTVKSEPALFRELAASGSESSAAQKVDLTVVDVTGTHVKDELVTALASHKYLSASAGKPLSTGLQSALGQNAKAADPVIKQIAKWLNGLCGGGTTTVQQSARR